MGFIISLSIIRKKKLSQQIIYDLPQCLLKCDTQNNSISIIWEFCQKSIFSGPYSSLSESETLGRGPGRQTSATQVLMSPQSDSKTHLTSELPVQRNFLGIVCFSLTCTDMSLGLLERFKTATQRLNASCNTCRERSLQLTLKV